MRWDPPKVARVPKFPLFSEDGNERMRFFTDAEVDALRAAATTEGPQWRALIELASYIGWRRGSLLSLRASAFNLTTGSLRVDTSKNGDPITVQLPATILACVRPLIGEPDALVFSQCTVSNIRYAWRRICKTAKVKDAIVHDFRRTAARNLRDAGVDRSIIKKIMGWKSDAMSERYGIVDTKDTHDALTKVLERESRNRTINAQNEDSERAGKQQVILIQ